MWQVSGLAEPVGISAPVADETAATSTFTGQPTQQGMFSSMSKGPSLHRAFLMKVWKFSLRCWQLMSLPPRWPAKMSLEVWLWLTTKVCCFTLMSRPMKPCSSRKCSASNPWSGLFLSGRLMLGLAFVHPTRGLSVEHTQRGQNSIGLRMP